MSAPEPRPVDVREDIRSDRPADRPNLGTATGPAQPQGERGGPEGPEPTRFGDWEKNGRCFDF